MYPNSEGQEAILDNPMNSVTQELETSTGGSENEENTRKYQLPPRSTRGIPPRRYDLEFESQRSRYPLSRVNEGNLTKRAKAFNMALYTTNVPETVEEAIKDKRWRKAMEEEFSALQKNVTWGKMLTSNRQKSCRMQMGIYYKIQCRWNNRKVQGKTCG